MSEETGKRLGHLVRAGRCGTWFSFHKGWDQEATGETQCDFYIRKDMVLGRGDGGYLTKAREIIIPLPYLT
jgi:hypothetical protein